jgi:hypothetical protein
MKLSDRISNGLQRSFPIVGMMPLLVATFIFAMAGAAAGQGVLEPISILYWDGSTLNVVGASGYNIPAGATYAIDEVDGQGLILIDGPNAAPPDPTTTSVPTITTPNGVTFQVPDAGNVSSIVQNGGSVVVTYKDGSTATVPGTYQPAGSPTPLPAPAAQIGGELWPVPLPPDSIENQMIKALGNDDWIFNFVGGTLPPADLPTDSGLQNSLLNDAQWTVADQSGTMTLTSPEPSSLTLLGIGAVSLLARFRRAPWSPVV